MKKCSRCKIDKPESDFNQHAYCKDCMKDWHFNRNLDIKQFIYEYRKVTPCVDCGFVGNPLLVEFDHVRGDKEFNLAHAFMKKGMTIDIVENEIAKCEIRCTHCHKIKTHRESNSWIWQIWEKENAQSELVEGIKL